MPPSFPIAARVALALACLVLLAGRASAGGGPENVFLVVNANGPSSMQVANHYVELRHVPPCNVFYLRTPPKANAMTGIDFRDKILRPTLAEISRRGLRSQIDQIVYSCEFPFFVDFTKMFEHANLEPRSRMASLTSATFLGDFVEREDAALTALDNNHYFTPPGASQTPTQGFRNSYQWAPGGKRVPTGGKQYLLATSLGFVQRDCNTVPEILRYLDRAAGADGTKPRGTFYFMENQNVRSTVRQPFFARAVAELKSLGLNAQIVPGVVPDGKQDIAGLTSGSAQVRLPAAKCQLLPGALVDNLTSAGAQLFPINRPNPQTRVTEYLRLGAAGASGTVVEPYAIYQKFPAPTLHVHYARGSTMAEAFYQSVAGPFQLLIVGDPLCRPWADIPEVSVAGLEGDVLSGAVEIRPTAKLAAGKAVSRFELFIDGIRTQAKSADQLFQLDTKTLADGYHEVRVVAIDDSAVETQGRWRGEVMVKNGRDAVQLMAADGARVTGDQISLRVAASRDIAVDIFHNNRSLGRVRGPQATLLVPTAKIGKGRVMLEARAPGQAGVRSRPLWLDIL